MGDYDKLATYFQEVGYRRVCIVTTIFPPYPINATEISIGGAVVDLTSLVEVLNSMDFNVSVVALDFPSKTKKRDPLNVHRIGNYFPYSLETSGVKNALRFISREFMDIPLLLSFTFSLRKIHPDLIIIGQTYGFGFIPFVGAKILRVPYSIRYDWLCPSYPEENPCNLKQRLAKCGDCMQRKNNLKLTSFSKIVFSLLTSLLFLLRKFFWRSAKTILVFNSFFKQYYAKYGISKERLIIVSPMRILPILNKSDDIRNGGFLRICFIGRLTREKGILLLSIAFRRIMSVSHEVFLTIAGDGPLRFEVENLQREYPENVSYLGWLEAVELSEVYQNSDAVVIPSIVPEANPIVAAEAMQFQKMIIGFGKGGLKDILSAYKKGIILNKISSQELSDEILELLKTNNAS